MSANAAALKSDVVFAATVVAHGRTSVLGTGTTRVRGKIVYTSQCIKNCIKISIVLFVAWLI